MLKHVWVLEEFARSDDAYVKRVALKDLTDSEMALILGVEKVPPADLLDVPDAALKLLASRYGLSTDVQRCYYLVGRSQPPVSAELPD